MLAVGDMKSAPEKSEEKDTQHDRHFLVVGIGASAGGIKALSEFFTAMPDNSGMAFVVILHLSQDHKSNLAEILQRYTQMPVEQVNETLKVEPNRVYVIPPAKHLEMTDGVIKVKEPQRVKGVRVPIDRFFRTLADAYGRKAVCIILSGTGTDGTVGMKHIKGRDGFAIVQDPLDAEYDGMLRSAIETKIADVVMHVSEMPEKLLSVRDSTEKFRLTDGQEGEVASEIKNIELLRDVLTLLRIRTGHDFSNYKRPTLIRRIARHLQIHETDDLEEYLTILRDKPDEVLSLLKNLLINVTNFFRDKEAFAALEKKVIPALFDGKTNADQVRIWIAGCASGEEAYSIAILICEFTATLPDPPKVQIFASDVDDDAITEAREGRFTESIVTDVSPDRLKEFFIKEEDCYRIRKRVREMILFAPHNVLRDPPFSRLDLISCRNVMIYLNRETQDKLLQVFHFALHNNGYLFLGSSESAESAANYYTSIDKKHRIYQCRPSSKGWHVPPQMPVHGTWTPRISELPEKTRGQLQSFGEMHHRLIEQYTPPSILVSDEDEILHLSESAGRFLRFTGGEPTNNLLKVVHPMLLSDLRAALFAAKRDNKPVEGKNIRVRFNGEEKFINLTVRPVGIPEAATLVIFDESDAEADAGESVQAIVAGDKAMESVVRGLEEELRHTKDQLRNTIEQYETSTEELKASNEELQAINEELRSATEELETSKEELQSVNEELTTVNHEYKEKLDEISRTNSDLQNLIQSTDIGTIFLDRELRIKRYTPRVGEIFNVIPSDVGRPLAHVTHHILNDEFSRDAGEVLRTLQSSEREVSSTEGHVFLVRFSPYRSAEEKIEGVVVAFIDITERKRVERSLRETEERMRLIVESAKDYAIFTTDMSLCVNSWNSGAEAVFGYSEAEIVGKSAEILFTPEDRKQMAPEKEAEKAFLEGRAENERWHSRKNGSRLYGSGLVMPLRNDRGEKIGLVKIMRDLTEKKHIEEALRASEERQAFLLKLSDALRPLDDAANIKAIANRLLGKHLGADRVVYEEHVRKDGKKYWLVENIYHVPEYPLAEGLYPLEGFGRDSYKVLQGETAIVDDVSRDEGISPEAKEVFRKIDVAAYVALPIVRAGKPIALFTLNQATPRSWKPDEVALLEETAERTWAVVERARAEVALRSSEERLQRMVNVPRVGVLTFDYTGTMLGANDAFLEMVGYSREEFAAREFTWRDFTPEEYVEASERIMQQLRETGRGGPYEKEYLRKDGSRIWFMFVAADLGDGTLVEYAIDITDRKRAELELQKAHDELETRVEQRTDELARTNEALSVEVEERKVLAKTRTELLQRVVTLQEDERQRIALDLHDQLGQQLTALRLKIASLQAETAKSDNLAPRVERLQEIATKLDSGVTFLAGELRPSALDDLGLQEALRMYVDEWSSRFEIPLSYHSNLGIDTRLHGDVEIHLYRIAQEALNNVVKHAKASEVSVTLERSEKGVVLIVEDNGVGFDPSVKQTTEPGHGFGLISMTERAILIGADIEIESSPGQGTTIYVRVPVNV